MYIGGIKLKNYNIVLSDEVSEKLSVVKKELNFENNNVAFANCVLIAHKNLKEGKL